MPDFVPAYKSNKAIQIVKKAAQQTTYLYQTYKQNTKSKLNPQRMKCLTISSKFLMQSQLFQKNDLKQHVLYASICKQSTNNENK